MVPIYDSHIHMDTRNCTDYEMLALSGVRRILIPCSPTHERRFCGRAWAARFDKLLNFERGRAGHFGIEAALALSVNGADLGDHRGAIEGLEALAARLPAEGVVAIGELALRTFSAAEQDIFERQLRLAGARGLPVIIEAPIGREDYARMLALLRACTERGLVDPARVCMVDLDRGKLADAARLGVGAFGVAVSPLTEGPFTVREKLDPHAVLALLRECDPARLMLNSGLHCGYADPLCLPRTVLRLQLSGLEEQTLRAIAHDNASRFFGEPGGAA